MWRTDRQGEDRIEDVEGAGVASEATLEELKPWTQYQVQIQAFNSIGPGPWSNAVAASTAESGKKKKTKKLNSLLFPVCKCPTEHTLPILKLGKRGTGRGV